MPPPPRALPEELLEEILLRLPPDDPGCLFRASLVCKPWRSRLTSSAFPRRYREFHGTPPLLGFFENDFSVCCWFAPLSPTSPFLPVHPGDHELLAHDARHGLVLLNGSWKETVELVVWDPVRHRQWELPFPEFDRVSGSAAVLCAVHGCDHLDCCGGPFLVVYVGTDREGVARSSVYSSEARAWGPVTSCEHPDLVVINDWPKVLVGKSVYFLCTLGSIILRYNLLSQELSMVTWPAMYKWEHHSRILMRMEDGVLGCASLQESRLELWAMEFGAHGAVKWVLRRVVELENCLPSRSSYVINFAEGVGVFFVWTNIGIFTVELKSGRIKKISSSTNQPIPYIRFYTPDQSGGITPPSTMASSDNVEMARDEHRDVLLSHLSGEVGDDKEKWVEKVEEDCEWEEDGWEDEEKFEEEKGAREKCQVRKQKKLAQVHFEDGSEAIEEGEFVRAQICFHNALYYMVLQYGRLSTMCISAYYKYGLALLYEAQSKIAPHQRLVKGVASKDDTRSTKASGSNIWEGDTRKGIWHYYFTP
uniref:Uncharacterized protein n=1 Tax=Avena sativa TaxID=4498 RepID=A0ACD5UCD7_AVESA